MKIQSSKFWTNDDGGGGAICLAEPPANAFSGDRVQSAPTCIGFQVGGWLPRGLTLKLLWAFFPSWFEDKHQSRYLLKKKKQMQKE